MRVRTQAAKWLWRRVRQAKVVVPLLRETVGDRDVTARLTAVETLGEMGAEDRVVPLLLQALEDRDVGVRLAAIEGLARSGAVKPLIAVLAGKNAAKAPGAVRALELIGADAREAVPALRKLADDPDVGVRTAAKETLAAIAAAPGKSEKAGWSATRMAACLPSGGGRPALIA